MLMNKLVIVLFFLLTASFVGACGDDTVVAKEDEGEGEDTAAEGEGEKDAEAEDTADGSITEDTGGTEDAGTGEDTGTTDAEGDAGGEDAEETDTSGDSGTDGGDDTGVSCGESGCEIGEACGTTSDCAAGLTCLFNGTCQKTCANNAECPEGYSCSFDEGLVILICKETGSLLASGETCAADSECASNVCFQDKCAQLCNGVTECAPGLVCKNIYFDSEQVDNGPSIAICDLPVGESDTLSVQTRYFGDWKTEKGKELGPIYFVVPEDALSALIDIDSSDDAKVQITELVDPEGKTILVPADYITPSNNHIRTTMDVAPGLVLISNKPDVPLKTGTYSVKFRQFSGTQGATITPRVFIKSTRDSSKPGEHLVVNFFFADIPQVGTFEPPTPENATTHPFFGLVTQKIHEFFAVSGIDTELNFYSTAGSGIEAVWTTEGSDSDLRKLFKLDSIKEIPRGLNVFNVRWVSSDAPGLVGADLNGFDGFIPGSYRRSTNHSGVAISVHNYEWTIEWYATVVLHEIAHYLGLFHTTESDGLLTDPLDDTSACSPAFDTDKNGMLYPDECKDFDGYQIMFWATTDETQYLFTQDQIQVMKSHPLIDLP